MREGDRFEVVKEFHIGGWRDFTIKKGYVLERMTICGSNAFQRIDPETLKEERTTSEYFFDDDEGFKPEFLKPWQPKKVAKKVKIKA